MRGREIVHREYLSIVQLQMMRHKRWAGRSFPHVSQIGYIMSREEQTSLALKGAALSCNCLEENHEMR